MRRITITCLTLVAAALLVLPATASAQKKRAKAATPQITRVQPMRINVGGKLTISGRNFKAKRGKNTVIFRAGSGRTAFAKPVRATKSKLVVRVPGSVSRLLTVSGTGQKPTRLKLRVLAGKFSKFTSRRLSPVVTGASDESGGGGPGGPGGAAACPGADYDGDLLPNTYEVDLKLDPCLADTDGDSVEDGYEYQSALDLNQYPRAVPLPYPGKRPYPNPLDPGDGVAGGTDYDGDGLKLREEFMLWLSYSADGARRATRPGSLASLVYSDGLQMSVDSPPPAAPAPGTLANWALDIDENGVLSDDERDADADGLGNWDELRGRMTELWWPAQHNGTIEPEESKYPDLDFLDNEDTAPAFDAHTDPDMDGDGVLDGADDNDHDGLSNQFELRRPDDWQADIGILTPATWPAGPNMWAYTNPFNPCKPYNSERCHAHPPFGHYDSDGAPPIGPNPPAGYPDPSTIPVTPDG